MSKALLYDATLCVNCKQCEQACADKNKLIYNDTIAAEDHQSEHKYTVVLAKGDKYMRRVTMLARRRAQARHSPASRNTPGMRPFSTSKCGAPMELSSLAASAKSTPISSSS